MKTQEGRRGRDDGRRVSRRDPFPAEWLGVPLPLALIQHKNSKIRAMGLVQAPGAENYRGT